MVYRLFRVQVALRTVLLALTLGFTVVLLPNGNLLMLAVLLGAWFLVQIVSLIRFVEKTNRDLARFFDSIRFEDFSQSFKDEGLGSSFSELRVAFSGVLEILRKTRADKEEHFRYLQTVVQHVPIGLVVFQPDGRVDLINTAAKHLLKIPRLKTIAEISDVSPQLLETFLRLAPREKGFVKIERENEILTLVLSATEFRLHGQDFKLVSLQNIHRELEEKEMEAWQKLIRVITHEIMNSVTPVSTLASTIGGLVAESADGGNADGLDTAERLKDIQDAARTIEKRSQGLLHFVDAFRSLTLLPQPKVRIFPIKDLFSRVERLMKANIAEKAISFSVTIEPETLDLEADPELIEQVLINLLLNALQVLEGRSGAEIRLRAFLNERGRIIIQVADNGPGIPPQDLEKVFIPFYSTKKGGSGIGLSLSRQIMRLHHGTIAVYSLPNNLTTFSLNF